jgi:hypothetical protein
MHIHLLMKINKFYSFRRFWRNGQKMVDENWHIPIDREKSLLPRQPGKTRSIESMISNQSRFYAEYLSAEYEIRNGSSTARVTYIRRV